MREWVSLEMGTCLENVAVKIVEKERRGRRFVGKWVCRVRGWI